MLENCFYSAFFLVLILTMILSVSGQQRSRMLATLFKDERCQQLAAYGILEKMYLDRIIRGNQLQEFAAMLMPHQKATTADGKGKSVVLKRLPNHIATTALMTKKVHLQALVVYLNSDVRRRHRTFVFLLIYDSCRIFSASIIVLAVNFGCVPKLFHP